MTVDVQTEGEFDFGIAETLFDFEGGYVAGIIGGPYWDIHPDGDRFLMLRPVGASGSEVPTSIVIVQNWLDELVRLAPAQ